MRTYEIRQEEEGVFRFTCESVPPEPHPGGYAISFEFSKCSETEAHKAAVFARMHEDVPLFELFDMLREGKDAN